MLALSINQVVINFNNTDILATVDKNGTKWIAVRPICEGMGIWWQTQQKKLRKNSKFNCSPMTTVGADGKTREMLALPITQVHTWLSEINPMRCKEDIRPAILKYQKECMDVLYSYWEEETL